MLSVGEAYFWLRYTHTRRAHMILKSPESMVLSVECSSAVTPIVIDKITHIALTIVIVMTSTVIPKP